VLGGISAQNSGVRVEAVSEEAPAHGAILA
jgi:hypothetical protein